MSGQRTAKSNRRKRELRHTK